MALAVNSRLGRTVQKVAGSAPFAKVMPPLLTPLDRVLNRLSGGRVMLSAALIPSMVLVTTGRRSGELREAPLAAIPEPKGGWLVVGSNFGREHHPAWTSNLLAEPEAVAVIGGRRIPVSTRQLTADEVAEAWPRITAVWPAYDRYVARTDRTIRVFRLTPT